LGKNFSCYITYWSPNKWHVITQILRLLINLS
jgi:hypothetical protein